MQLLQAGARRLLARPPCTVSQTDLGPLQYAGTPLPCNEQRKSCNRDVRKTSPVDARHPLIRQTPRR